MNKVELRGFFADLLRDAVIPIIDLTADDELYMYNSLKARFYEPWANNYSTKLKRNYTFNEKLESLLIDGTQIEKSFVAYIARLLPGVNVRLHKPTPGKTSSYAFDIWIGESRQELKSRHSIDKLSFTSISTQHCFNHPDAYDYLHSWTRTEDGNAFKISVISDSELYLPKNRGRWNTFFKADGRHRVRSATVMDEAIFINKNTNTDLVTWI